MSGSASAGRKHQEPKDSERLHGPGARLREGTPSEGGAPGNTQTRDWNLKTPPRGRQVTWDLISCSGTGARTSRSSWLDEGDPEGWGRGGQAEPPHRGQHPTGP